MVFASGGVVPLGTNDFYADSREKPRVYAWVGSFFVDKFEVTNRRYALFLEWRKTAGDPDAFAHPLQKAAFPEGKDPTPAFWHDSRFNQPDQPVVGVDWFDAWAYARWAGKALPSEAQWEAAASCDPKSRVKRKYPWGDEEPTSGQAVWDTDRPGEAGHRSAGASPIGAQDMAGNAAEWCLDAYDDGRWEALADDAEKDRRSWVAFRPLRFAEGSGLSNPLEIPFDPEKSEWTVRGGAFDDGDFGIRTVARAGARGRSERIGFRCVWVPRGSGGGGEGK
jgi:formylglycine-generating enzyme required for sulfatase activity